MSDEQASLWIAFDDDIEGSHASGYILRDRPARRLRLPDRDVVRISLDIPDDLAQGLAEQGQDLFTDLNARIRGVNIGPDGARTVPELEPTIRLRG
jgi:hypothetical protein